jgi:FtsZ-binding cell division protein ZapB
MDNEVIEKLKSALDLVENLKTENAYFKEQNALLKRNYASVQDEKGAISKELSIVGKEKELKLNSRMQLKRRRKRQNTFGSQSMRNGKRSSNC